MVQQQQQQQQAPLANGTQLLGPQQQQQHMGMADGATLAMAALVGQPAGQYSPQTSLYQQQLIKGAQQFAPQQRQQQQQQQIVANGRLNGTASNGVLHHSPQQQQQQQQQYSSQQGAGQIFSQLQMNEALYTSSPQQQQQQQVGRPAPLYAPKPAFYAHIAAPQAQAASQMYQAARQQQQQAAFYQPQASPSSQALVLGQQQQQQAGANHLGGLHVQSAASLQQQQLEQQQQQQQRQMQQLVMSYQQQQEQLQLQLQQQQQQSAAYLGARHLEAGANWPTGGLREDSSHQTSASQAELLRQQQAPRAYLRAAAGRLSDRDSVSTMSRANQLDERRSFTMRSQFTAPATRNKQAKQFSFLELTSEALKSALGLTGGGGGGGLSARSQRQPLLPSDQGALGPAAEQLRRNIRLTMGGGEQPKQAGQLGRVTVIDSGEDYHFKRQVFRYQLAIVRLVHVLLSALVLLSPVAMLLLPKMEPLLGASGLQQPQQQLELPEHPQLEGGGGGAGRPVTHAVGLASRAAVAAAAKQQQAAQIQQQQPPPPPQWRISECQSSECDGPLIGFVARLSMLALAHWALFFRAQTASLPRADIQRCLLVSLALLVTLAYWLFFLFRVFDKRHQDYELHYMTIVQFAISMLETLLVLHYLALALVGLSGRKKTYCLKLVRSPDGEARYYSCGALSIQKCAQFVLDKYHRDFRAFDAHASQLLGLEEELARELDRTRRQRQHDSSSSGAREQPRGRRRQDEEEEADEGRALTSEGQEEEEEEDEERSSRRHHGRRRAHHRRRRRQSSSATRRANQDEDDDDDDEDPTADRSDDDGSGGSEAEKDAGAAGGRSPSRSPARPAASKRRRRRNEASGPPPRGESGAEQSSDATTGRPKESSLETVRAASGANDDERAAATSAAPNDLEISERPRSSRAARSIAQEARNELESVRSARSRRSTSSRAQRGRERRRSSTQTPAAAAAAAETAAAGASSGGRRQREPSGQRERSASRPLGAHELARAPSRQQASWPGHSRDSLEELERKLRRRQLRLLAAVADSFEQVRQLEDEAAQATGTLGLGPSAGGAQAAPPPPPPPAGLDASQAARHLYPQIARSLQKYLRLTKQTGRHNLQSIYEHLAKCLLYKLSARAFLEKFTNFGQVWQANETQLFANCRLAAASGRQATAQVGEPLELNSWSLVCDTLLSRQIGAGTFFLLKQGQVSLLVTVAKLPHLSLSEQVLDPAGCKFALAPPNPETSCV